MAKIVNMPNQEMLDTITGEKKIDNVDHPPHYNMGKFEVIDVIEDWELGFHLGSAVKYIGRCEHKGELVQDIKKAIWYLERVVELNTTRPDE